MVDPIHISSFRPTESGQKSAASLNPPGGGSTFDPMEPRVSALEKTSERIEKRLDEIVKELSEVKVGVAGVRGRLEAMPTTIQLLLFVVAIFTAAGLTRFLGG